MNYYANPDERARLIAGLRDLAEFLDQNPQVPAPRYTDLLVFPPTGTDAEMFAEVDVIAEQIGVTASQNDTPARPLHRFPLLRPRAVPRGRDSSQRPTTTSEGAE